MTTNHKPTLESRRGRQLDKTSIVHARALPAHKQLKFRAEKVDQKEAKEKIEELKRELLLREKEHYKEVGLGEEGEEEEEEEGEEQEQDEQETYAQKRRRIQLENQDDSEDDGEEEGEDSDSESEPESDSGSESDPEESKEALLLELQKIKREKAEQQQRLEDEQRKEAALKSNPLLNQSGAKKSWRQATVFRNTASQTGSKEKEGDNYVNDALRSDFHRRFLDRYIK